MTWMLGDILAAARRQAGSFEQWLQERAPGLALEVESAAAGEGLRPAGYMRAAMADFERFATDEDWATLASVLRDSDDPGTACLLVVARWRLAAPACGAHSSGRNRIESGVRNVG